MAELLESVFFKVTETSNKEAIVNGYIKDV